jgi:hypothetical protein
MAADVCGWMSCFRALDLNKAADDEAMKSKYDDNIAIIKHESAAVVYARCHGC